MDGSTLNQDVASIERGRDAIVHFHVNFSRHHHCIVDRVGSMVSWQNPRFIAHNPEDATVVQSGLINRLSRIVQAIVVDWKALGGPSNTGGDAHST